MRKLILFLFIFFSYSAYSQDVIMSKEKHELLRKDIENYKKLIVTHKKLQNENKVLLDSIAILNYKVSFLTKTLSDCKCSGLKRKNFFRKMQDKLIKMRRKKNHKPVQNW